MTDILLTQTVLEAFHYGFVLGPPPPFFFYLNSFDGVSVGYMYLSNDLWLVFSTLYPQEGVYNTKNQIVTAEAIFLAFKHSLEIRASETDVNGTLIQPAMKRMVHDLLRASLLCLTAQFEASFNDPKNISKPFRIKK